MVGFSAFRVTAWGARSTRTRATKDLFRAALAGTQDHPVRTGLLALPPMESGAGLATGSRESFSNHADRLNGSTLGDRSRYHSRTDYRGFVRDDLGRELARILDITWRH